MGQQTGFHASNGSADFLGYRRGRDGCTEIVYDGGANLRMVWRVCDPQVNDAQLSEALGHAVNAFKVVPAMITEFGKRAIALEQLGS